MLAMARFNPAFTPEERERVLRRTRSSHPLEIIPAFRRLAPSSWRDFAYTFIWNVGFTALFLFIGMIASLRLPSVVMLWSIFVIANCVGYTLHFLFHVTSRTVEPAIHRRGRLAVAVFYMLQSTVGVFLGFWIASLLLGRRFLPSSSEAISIAVTSMVISIVLAVVFFWREKSALAEAELEREQRRAADIERESMLANLRALQAQIEPHFLFNTLANVTSLIDSEPAKAKHMLESFIRFLRASLAATRRKRATLADEFALISDFLEVLKVRMGDRLEVRIALPADIAAVEIPPMLVQPLVENAIRHGLEPEVDGGVIELRARREGGRLILEVADTGTGFGDTTSGGLGLVNVRERLRLAHGEEARLAIRENAPRGTIVAIELPLAMP